MSDYTKLIEALRCENHPCKECEYILWFEDEDANAYTCDEDRLHHDAADAIEKLQDEVKRLQDKLCDWCAVCPKERRRPEDCELLGETPVMYGPSGAKMEVQDGQ